MPEKLLLTLLSGPDPGREFLIEPDAGVRLAVGRAAECPVWIDDPTVSRRHFEIFWAGETLQLSDAGSSNGTFVNGERVGEAVIRAGDEIRAGDVVFRLDPAGAPAAAAAAPAAVEGRDLPLPPGPPLMAPVLTKQKRESPQPPAVFRACGPVDPVEILRTVDPVLSPAMGGAPAPGSRLGRLIGGLAGGQRLYAIVDGAENFELAVMGRLMGHAAYSLFAAEGVAELATTGPSLIALGDPDAYLETWDQHIGSNAGLLLESDAAVEYVHAHIRRIFVVVDQQDQEYALPYHIPEQFRAVLPACTPAQLQEFFGPVRRWICEDAEGADYLACAFRDGRLQVAAMSAAAG